MDAPLIPDMLAKSCAARPIPPAPKAPKRPRGHLLPQVRAPVVVFAVGLAGSHSAAVDHRLPGHSSTAVDEGATPNWGGTVSIMLVSIMFPCIIMVWSSSVRRTASPGSRAPAAGRIRRHLGPPPRRQVTPAHRVVAAPRWTVHRRRPIGVRYPAALPRCRCRRAIPRICRCRVSGLAVVPRAPLGSRRACELAGTVYSRRVALPDRRRSLGGRCAAELARQPCPAAMPGSQRVEPAHDAQRRAQRRCSIVRARR